MIEYVRGTVGRRAEDHVVIDVGGIGIRVEAAPATVAALSIGSEHEVPTSLVVREDAWTLYGFTDDDEREVFVLVQTVSGIGPRTAQALVATLTADGLRQAVQRQDTATIMTVPGIGRKGAQRILLELADRLGPPTGRGSATVEATPAGQARWHEDVITGLVGLGWSQREAEAAVGAVAGQVDTDADVAVVLKAALRELKRT